MGNGGVKRGDEKRQEGFIMHTSLEDRVPTDHPLRAVRRMVDETLREMRPLLDSLYARRGRGSIPPEYLLRAQLLNITPHVAEKKRYRAIDGRTTTWEGYAVS